MPARPERLRLNLFNLTLSIPPIENVRGSSAASERAVLSYLVSSFGAEEFNGRCRDFGTVA